MSDELPEVDYDKDVYEVFVQNVGRVHHSNSRGQAKYTFDYYVKLSKEGIGRVEGASVDFYKNEEIEDQFIGEIEANGG